jgi:hypothetical protein
MALQVREIESTLPPMKLDIPPTAPPAGSLRETRSADALVVGEMGFGSTNGSREPSPYHADVHEEEIQMSFDTSFDDTAHTREHLTVPGNDESGLSRPEMKSSQTLPNLSISDPWADAEDEDFGKEKEISMTFA